VRTTAQLDLAEATAIDVPATKSTPASHSAKCPWALVVFSALCLLLSLGSYEQAVMVPSLLLGVWLLFWLRGYRSAWWPHAMFWALLVAYLVLRSCLVPTEVSGYQAQQFRSGPGLFVSLGDYLLPSAYPLYTGLASVSAGWLLVLVGSFWSPIVAAAANVATLWECWTDRQWKWTFFGLMAMSIVAFLPMAWLKMFEHYHYLPSAFRAACAVVLSAVVARLLVSAASLPELPTPARPDPAPGSHLRQ
jgi:hypothetical protein